MKKSEFLLFDLRNVIMSDCQIILDAMSTLEWNDETKECKQMLLNHIDNLHARWDDLYQLEWGKK